MTKVFWLRVLNQIKEDLNKRQVKSINENVLKNLLGITTIIIIYPLTYNILRLEGSG